MLNNGLATILISLSLQDLCDALSGSSFLFYLMGSLHGIVEVKSHCIITTNSSTRGSLRPDEFLRNGQ